MKLHLNFDGKQNNGVIFNAAYQGALYSGIEFKPVTTFSFESFTYSEVFTGQPNYVILVDGTKRLMTAEEEAEVIQLATSWVQPLGQEGNPTQAQIDEVAAKALKDSKQAQLDMATVEVDGLVFQADEKSIGFMTSTIITSETTSETTSKWIMKDNSKPVITIAQLRQAQALAMKNLATIKGV